MCFIFSINTLAENEDSDLKSLESVLGSYPPAINSDQQKNEVIEKYESLKKKYDLSLMSTPNSEEILYKRGLLQSFGHNMDYPNAWSGADEDLRSVLNINPSNVRAILDLANLYVNSNPDLAPKAELLYKGAQCFLDPEPEEKAQRGLFFAYFYQGELDLAYKQTLVLNKLWPKNGYEKLVDMSTSVLKRKNEKIQKYRPNQLTYTSCEKLGSHS